MEEQINILNIIELMRKALLRSETCLKPEKPPVSCSAASRDIIGDYSIGYSLNLLNNSYTLCKIARKKGCDAKLFLDPDFGDIFATSSPAWEECDFVMKDMPETAKELPQWKPPDFVKTAHWNLGPLNEVSQNFEYEKLQELYKGAAIELIPKDQFSYLMAYSVLPHRDLLTLYSLVDILHVCGSHIGLASFSNKPYVTLSYGSDLFNLPFEDTEIGWMQCRGYRKATRHIVAGKWALEHMERLGISRRKMDLIPFMIDTDFYAPLKESPLRPTLRKKHAGKVIFFVGARQNWAWKGSNKLIRAISKVKKRTDKAVFLSVWYGQDIDRSEELIKDLKLGQTIQKIGVLSKGAMRRYVDAADVCIDQFTHGALGTFALESMSMGKPLIAYCDAEKHFDFREPPPLLNAFSEDEIAGRIMDCIKGYEGLPQIGSKHREWIKLYHGHDILWPVYDEVYRKALMSARWKQ